MGREGLGLRKRQYYKESNKKERIDLMVKEVRGKEATSIRTTTEEQEVRKAEIRAEIRAIMSKM